jgi:DNA polymerase III subunit epsilon
LALPYANTRREVAKYVQQKLQERPVYLDTETTGLEKGDEIVEISIIDDEGCILFDSLIRPSQKIPASSTRIHGITDEMVKTVRPWPLMWQEIRSVLSGRLVVIYNADFDLRLMQQSHTRYKMPWRESINAECAMKLYAKYRNNWDPQRRSYRFISLEDARKQCSLTLPNAHRATADALLARAVFRYMAENE